MRLAERPHDLKLTVPAPPSRPEKPPAHNRPPRKGSRTIDQLGYVEAGGVGLAQSLALSTVSADPR